MTLRPALGGGVAKSGDSFEVGGASAASGPVVSFCIPGLGASSGPARGAASAEGGLLRASGRRSRRRQPWQRSPASAPASVSGAGETARPPAQRNLRFCLSPPPACNPPPSPACPETQTPGLARRHHHPSSPPNPAALTRVRSWHPSRWCVLAPPPRPACSRCQK